jgi:hypothetical protein
VSFNYDKVCGCVEPEERDPIVYNNTYLERFRRAAPWIRARIDAEAMKELLDAVGEFTVLLLPLAVYNCVMTESYLLLWIRDRIDVEAMKELLDAVGECRWLLLLLPPPPLLMPPLLMLLLLLLLLLLRPVLYTLLWIRARLDAVACSDCWMQ